MNIYLKKNAAPQRGHLFFRLQRPTPFKPWYFIAFDVSFQSSKIPGLMKFKKYNNML